MRLIGELNEMRALHVSNALAQRRIEHRLEMHGTMTQVWVADEDRLEEAKEVFAKASVQPIPMWLSPPREEAPLPVKKQALITPVTLFFMILCVVIYLIESIQFRGMDQISPIQGALLFDLPSIADASQAYWRGIYEVILLKAKTGDASLALGPMFVKIREGEVWRLFSPALLHGGFLHILFNMIWLWVLGRPIEQRIGAFRTILLTLFFGIGTNTIQYLISGPFFLGYSGIIMGLAGFIWMRERVAPWEGYPLNRSTIIFLGLFVFSMFALQAASFLVQLLTNLPFVLNIANAAHVGGGFLGALLGRCSFFAWRTTR